jgi:orotate phosphoribosyltransferase
MDVTTVREHLDVLRESVRAATVHGGFLLSNGEVSDYWVPINRLRTDHVTEAVVGISTACLPRFRGGPGAQAVAVPQLTTTSEDIFPWDAVVSGVRHSMRGARTNHAVEFHSIICDRHRNSVELPVGAPAGAWLVVFTISVHSHMILSVVEGLRRSGRTVRYVLVLVEREKVTREHLRQDGVELVPLISCDNDTGEPRTILDLSREPYSGYHRFFME